MNQLMNVAKTAEYLKISKGTLYKLIKNKKVPFFLVGSQIRFKKEFLDQWLEGK